jgi:serine/threonine protein kinase
MIPAGTRVGPYEVVSWLGAGGMGEVYRARDTKLDREVALKTLPDELARQPERLARLRQEARILASLNHPGIATLHGLEEVDGGVPVLVMDLVEGETLADRLRRGPLPPPDAIAIAHHRPRPRFPLGNRGHGAKPFRATRTARPKSKA